MNKWNVFLILAFFTAVGYPREPFKPSVGTIPFIVYYQSYYRGICVGTLLSRTAVLTAAVCVVDPTMSVQSRRAINVITGTMYRHPRRGIRVQVTKLLIPRLPDKTTERAFMIQMSPALMLLARKIPDVLAEVPLRPIAADFKAHRCVDFLRTKLVWPSVPEITLAYLLHDKIFPVHKFLLQRNIRAQFLIIVKKNLWCNTITLKFEKAMMNLGFTGYFEKSTSLCVRDPDREAQPCHGMYGAPLICQGKVVAMMTAPDAQWTNCTGFTNVVHLLSADYLRDFMTCVSSLFDPEYTTSWENMKKQIESDDEDDRYDFLPDLYDRIVDDTSSSDEF